MQRPDPSSRTERSEEPEAGPGSFGSPMARPTSTDCDGIACQGRVPAFAGDGERGPRAAALVMPERTTGYAP